jgi:hypothetical protein
MGTEQVRAFACPPQNYNAEQKRAATRRVYQAETCGIRRALLESAFVLSRKNNDLALDDAFNDGAACVAKLIGKFAQA